MSKELWPQRPRPVTDGDAVVLAVWDPVTPCELTLGRRQLSAALHDGVRPPATAEGAVERLLLCHEELASNAMLHGRLPVRVEVLAGPGWWLLDVSDAAPDNPPVPATDRDPSDGGLGLHLVPRVCAAHGWYVADGRKHVWALIHHRPAEESTSADAR
jgi:hypothetical protein